MLRYRLNQAERRLLGRESAWQWEFVHEPGERWIALLVVLGVIAGLFLAMEYWLYHLTYVQ